MDKHCDVCGDVGVFDAIVTCSQCKTNCEHVYCMRNQPKNGDDIWVCGACEKSKEIVSPKYGEKKDLPGTVLPNSSGPVHHIERRVFWEKKVKTGKVKYMCSQEAILLSSGAKKSESPTKVNLRQSAEPSKTVVSMPLREPVKCKTVPLNLSSYKVKPNPSFRPGHLKSPKHGSVKINSTVRQVTPTSKELQGKQSALTPMKEDTRNEQAMGALNPSEEIGTTNEMVEKTIKNPSCAFSPSTCCPNITSPGKQIELTPMKEDNPKEQAVGALNPSEEIGTTGERVEKAINNPSCAFSPSTCCPNITSPGGKPYTDVEPINSEVENGSMVIILPTDENLCPNHPAPSATWKGSFKIHDTIEHGELNDGFEAHPSDSVHRKVYEFSKRMPEVIHFEMLPRSKFWKDMFSDDIPDRDDIGLYFFSKDGERSDNYIFLLEYLEMHDLLMRSCMDDVELLVLTSKLLSLDSQSWKEHYFLWGVFRPVKRSESLINDPPLLTYPLHCTNGEDSEVVDMDIDMIGGEYVGRVDLSIQKESSKQGSKISWEKTADPITLHDSNATSPAASRKLDFPIGKTLLEVKREFFKDIPPGFEETLGRKFKEISCRTGDREEKMSPAKDRKSLERVSAFGAADNSKPKKPSEVSYYQVKVENPVDEIRIGSRRQSLHSKFEGSPDNFSHSPRSPVKIKREVE